MSYFKVLFWLFLANNIVTGFVVTAKAEVQNKSINKIKPNKFVNKNNNKNNNKLKQNNSKQNNFKQNNFKQNNLVKSKNPLKQENSVQIKPQNSLNANKFIANPEPVKRNPVVENKVKQPSAYKSKIDSKYYVSIAGALNFSSYSSGGRAENAINSFTTQVTQKFQNSIFELKEKEQFAIPQQITLNKENILNTENTIALKEKEKEALNNLMQAQITASNQTGATNTFNEIFIIDKEINQLKEDAKEHLHQISLLETQLLSISNQISVLENEITKVENMNQDLKNISNDASSLNISALFALGYEAFYDKFFFNQEIGLEFGKYKIGSNNKNQISINGGIGVFINTKIGYVLSPEFNAYLGFGLKQQNVSASYVYDVFDLKSSQSVKFFTFLFGMEKVFSAKIRFFSEINYEMAMNKVRFEATKQDLEIQNIGIKGGIKYYF